MGCQAAHDCSSGWVEVNVIILWCTWKGACFRLEVYRRVEISYTMDKWHRIRAGKTTTVTKIENYWLHFSHSYYFSLLGIGLLYINASVWQMLRGSLIIFTGVLSVSIWIFLIYFFSFCIWCRNKMTKGFHPDKFLFSLQKIFLKRKLWPIHWIGMIVTMVRGLYSYSYSYKFWILSI